MHEMKTEKPKGRSKSWEWVLLGLFILALSIYAAYTFGSFIARSNASKPLTSIAQQEYEGTQVSGTADDFTLVDQNNQEIALSDFRGSIIVLLFMDTQCEEVCPLTALHLRIAYERMKRENVDVAHVVFIGVNVNLEASSPEDVKSFTEKFGLDSIPTWHFLTGTNDQLEPLWGAYDITIQPQENGEIIHTPGVYIIDQQGEKRWYVSTPLYGENIETWTTPFLSDLLVRHVKSISRQEMEDG